MFDPVGAVWRSTCPFLAIYYNWAEFGFS